MKTLFINTAPLAAGASLVTPWLDRSGSGDVPYFSVLAASDQPGSFQIFETEVSTSALVPGQVPVHDDFNAIAGGAVAGGLVPCVVSGNVNRRFFCVVYTNGPVAQTVMSLACYGSSTPHIAPRSDDWRALDLILRELRAQSLLLDNLRNPAGSTVNVPYGPTNSSN